jgi:genome maintenance exonuclease 1
MQLCAYANAHNEIYGTNISKGVVLMCSKDFEYQEFIIEEDEFAEYERRWWTRVGEYYGA